MMESLKKHIGKIGAFTATGIGIDLLLCQGETTPLNKKATEVPKDKDCDCDTSKTIKKTIGTDSRPSKKIYSSPSITGNKKRTAKKQLPVNQYQKDLERFGTKQGVIDVSNKELVKKERKSRLNKMGKIGQDLVNSRLAKAISKPISTPSTKSISDHNQWLQSSFETTQISITNASGVERPVRLFGAHKGIQVSPPNPEDVEDHTILKTVTVPVSLGQAIHPTGVVINPKNGFTYIANQLSNNVTVLDGEGEIVRVIQLQPSSYPGYNSPVALAVHSVASNSNYGKVYVVGSVANTVSVIDNTFTVSAEIEVGVRPLDIRFNPINNNLYVANYASNDVSVIDTGTESVTDTIAAGNNPIGIGIRSSNGDVYVSNEADNSIAVFDVLNQPVTTIANVGNRPARITYFPPTDEMFVVGNESDDVTPIDTATYTATAPIPVGNEPFGIAFNAANNFIYIGNQLDHSYTIIANDKSVRATINAGNVGVDFAFDDTGTKLFASDIINSTVNVIGFSDESNAVIIDEGFAERAKDFQHNPAIVKHVKFIFSNQDRFKTLTLREEQVRGKVKDVPISFTTYQSPQNFLNVSEVHALEGSVIDGLNSWLFNIGAHQSISILIYYKQLEMYHLLPTSQEINKTLQEEGSLNHNYQT